MQAAQPTIKAFLKDESAAVSVEWVVITAGVMALCVGA
jgi:Flp pilus assembly pilin Flp